MSNKFVNLRKKNVKHLKNLLDTKSIVKFDILSIHEPIVHKIKHLRTY